MKKPLLFSFLLVLSLSACKSKAEIEKRERLPKDVALQPERDYSKEGNDFDMEKDRERLSQLRSEIQALIDEVSCSDAEKWRISPLGSKPCGGPAAFIAYPIEKEDEILPKISDFNQRSSSFNLKYGILSDCSVTPAPSSVRCEGGKPELVYDNRGGAVSEI